MIATLAPVVRTVDVNADVDKAFRVFTERIGEWWPLETHGIYGDKAETCILEGQVGGRLYERSVDGEEADWAEVTAYDPPSRFVLAWKPNPSRPAPTEIEVTFTQQGEGTHVQLTHTGWDLLGDEGAEARDSYNSGWPETLARYAGHVDPS
ncbi:MAG: hypothetical protein QOG04_8 [Actinomycetota bacterium]|jgi:uncharacterized protein YndB with AHSA1/START domain|nr:hypothetical protein [Actinomycetota bacterium]